jgi:hypothetical protein
MHKTENHDSDKTVPNAAPKIPNFGKIQIHKSIQLKKDMHHIASKMAYIEYLVLIIRLQTVYSLVHSGIIENSPINMEQQRISFGLLHIRTPV